MDPTTGAGRSGLHGLKNLDYRLHVDIQSFDLFIHYLPKKTGRDNEVTLRQGSTVQDHQVDD